MKAYLIPALLLPISLLTSCSLTFPSSTSWLASAAVAAVVSAIVSGLVAIFIKEKEYKNDYYKKVIEKRLNAIESMEEVIGMLARHSYALGSSELYHSIFTRLPAQSSEYTESLSKASKYIIWHNTDTSIAFNNFCALVSEAMIECDDLNPLRAMHVAVKHFERIDNAMRSVHDKIRYDMSNLHNVEAFFQNKLKQPSMPR